MPAKGHWKSFPPHPNPARNLIAFSATWACIHGHQLKVTSRLEREGQVVHLIADHIEDRSRDLSLLGHPSDDVLGQMGPKTDDVPVHLKSDAQKTRAMHPREQAKRLFPSRDFH